MGGSHLHQPDEVRIADAAEEMDPRVVEAHVADQGGAVAAAALRLRSVLRALAADHDDLRVRHLRQDARHGVQEFREAADRLQPAGDVGHDLVLRRQHGQVGQLEAGERVGVQATGVDPVMDRADLRLVGEGKVPRCHSVGDTPAADWSSAACRCQVASASVVLAPPRKNSQ